MSAVLLAFQDASTCRLKRSFMYTGTVANHIDLQAFPFDVDKIDVELCTSVMHPAGIPKTS